MEADLTVLDVVDSTNITLEQMAENNAGEGTCVVAFEQRKGQGRFGRSFYSPKGGNLYMSLLLRPKNDFASDMITIAAAAATAGAIRNVFHIDTGIKWVNDIIYRGRKVCGIIAQAHNIGTDGFYVVLGIGINIYASTVPEDIKDIYGSLFDDDKDKDENEKRDDAISLAKEIIRLFFGYYEEESSCRCIDDYRKDCIVTGDVEYISGDVTVEAKAVGIADDGSIILEIDGKRTSYRDGEIRIRLKNK